MNKNKFLILGGGFSGLTLARVLSRYVSPNSVTLVSKSDYFLFTPNLYEVATAEEELAQVSDLKASIAIPISQMLKKSGVKYVKAEVKKVDIKNSRLEIPGKYLEFEHLFVSPGSVSEYFNISGAKENALPLKSFEDALRVKNAIEFAVQAASSDVKKKVVRIIVAGGGYTGVELAGELPGFLDHVAWKNQYPREKIEVLVVEAVNELIPGLDSKLSKDAALRLRSLGVRLSLNSFISKVEPNFLELKSGERIASDVCIWTAGVKSSELPGMEACEKDPKGRLKVNSHFQLINNPNIYILGDKCCYTDNSGKVAPPTAQDAIHQAEYVGGILPSLLKNRTPKPYECLNHGYVIIIGGQWAILKHGYWYIKGHLAYFAKQVAHFRFFYKFLGIWNAAKLTVFQVKIYSRND